jgi:hypothetical protein
VRRVAFIISALVLLVAPATRALACSAEQPCVHAEPAWLAPAARALAFVSADPVPEGLAASVSAGFRLAPAVVNLPAPNRAGRDVNVLRHATDLTVGLRAGVGDGLEVTLVVPAGLYQRGAGIKGVTHQSAPPIAAQTLHDPRLGFGFELPRPAAWLRAKLRLELKLPLGSEAALAGEGWPVSSPSVALIATRGGFFAAAELGARLRRPSDALGARVGSQGLLAVGVGYALSRPRLTFAAEAYALPALARAGRTHYLPAEWLVSTRFSPGLLPPLSVGVSGGSGVPLSRDGSAWFFGFGVPRLRALFIVSWSPSDG